MPTITISSGVTSSSLTVSSGEVLDVLSGGGLQTATVLAGGSATLEAGAVASSLTVSAGGAVLGAGEVTGANFVAGVISGVAIDNGIYADASLELQSGGVASDVTLTADVGFFGGSDALTIDAGATATGVTLAGAAVDFVYGSAVDVLVGSGQQTIEAGGVAVGASISGYDASETVSAGGLSISATVISGGLEQVLSGGEVSGLTVESVGVLALAGGTAVDVKVLSGGHASIAGTVSGDLSYGAAVSNTLTISGVTFSSGAVLTLTSDAVLSGATLSIGAGGQADALTISKGAKLIGRGDLGDDSRIAGTMSGLTYGRYGDSDTTLTVSSGGSVLGVEVLGLGDLVLLKSGASASGVTLSANDYEGLQIAAGATASKTTIHGYGSASNSGFYYYGGSAQVFGSAVSDTVGSGGVEYVNSGGVSIDTVVLSGGVEVELAGGVIHGATVQSGGRYYGGDDVRISAAFVASAGPVAGTTVLGGVTIASGGFFTLVGATILSGGALSLGSGAFADSLVVSRGGHLIGDGVLQGSSTVAGAISGLTVNDGDALTLLAGGTASRLDVLGQFVVDARAETTSAKLTDYASASVFGSAQATVVSAYAVQSVKHGGVSDRTVITKSGTEIISSGGLSQDAAVSGGGTQLVLSGGASVSAKVASGAIESVSSGGTITGVTVEQGGQLLLSGTAVSATVLSGGSVFYYNAALSGDLTIGFGAVGQTIDGLTVSSGGFFDLVGADVLSGAVVSLASAAEAQSIRVEAGGVLSGPGSLQGSNTVAGEIDDVTLNTRLYSQAVIDLLSGASANDLTITGGSYYPAYYFNSLEVEAGATASATTLVDYGHAYVYGSAVGTIIGLGSQTVESGGVSSDTAVGVSGAEAVLSSGVSFAATVGSGGLETISAGGVGVSANLAGGQLQVSSGGAASDTQIGSGGAETVWSGGVSVDATVAGGGVEDVMVGGVVSGLTVEAGGVLQLSGTAVAASVQSGGAANIYGAMIASDLDLVSGPGGASVVDGVAIAEGATLTLVSATVLSGATATLGVGTVADSWVVLAGGVLAGAGAVRNNTSVFGEVDGVTVGTDAAFGRLTLLSGGVASGVTVLGDLLAPTTSNTLVIDAGAKASATTIASRGFAQVFGSAVGDAIDGGLLVVEAHGLTTSDIVGSRGEEALLAGGVASDVTVELAGQLSVASGAKIYDATIERGGALGLVTGAAASGSVVDAGGKVYLQATVSSAFDAGRITSAVTVDHATVMSGALIDFISADVLGGGSLSLGVGGWTSGLTVSAGGLVNGAGQVLGYSTVAGEIDAVTVGRLTHATFAFLELESGGSASSLTVAGADRVNIYYAYSDTIRVDAGATATDTLVLSGGEVEVFGSAAGTIVSNGAQYVESGGSDTAAVVDSGSLEDVSKGGFAGGATVQAGGLQIVASGGAVSGTVVEGGATLTAYLGASTVATRVLSGGDYHYGGRVSHDLVAGYIASLTILSGVALSSGADLILDGAEITSGASVTFAPGAVASSLAVLAGGAALGDATLAGYNFVSGTLSGASVGAADETSAASLDVRTGGVASNATVSGGYLFTALSYQYYEANILDVESGGLAIGAVIGSGAVADVHGSMTRTTLAGGEQNVYGQTESSVVSSGGVERVFSGGADSDATVLSGGTMVVTGGSAAGVEVSSGGTLKVVDGGTASGTVESGGVLYLDGSFVGSFGLGVVASDQVVDGVTVRSGAEIELVTAKVGSGETLSLVSQSVVGQLKVAAGGKVLGPGTLIGSSQDAGIVSGVTLTDTTGGDIGVLTVLSGGVADAVTVRTSSGYGVISERGGDYYYYDPVGLVVDSGGSASGTVLQSGSQELVWGADVGATLDGSEYVLSGATTTSARIGEAGTQTVAFGGVATATTVGRGGTAVVLSGGTASGVIVLAGGDLILDSGGAANGHVDLGGSLFAYSSEVASNTTIGALLSAKVVSGVTVSSGAYLDLLGADVLGGRTLEIVSGAAAASLRVLTSAVVDGAGTLLGSSTIAGAVNDVTLGTAETSGDVLTVLTSGAISGVSIEGRHDSASLGRLASAADVVVDGQGAELYVGGGGTAVGTIVKSGVEDVQGVTSGSLIESGGTEAVLKYGTAIGATVRGGGVLSGAGAGRSTVGGLTTVSSGATIEGVAVASGAEVRLDEGGTISGVNVLAGGELLLVGAQIGSGASLTAATEILKVSANGVGVASGGALVLSNTTVSNGGLAAVARGGLAINTLVSEGGTESVASDGVASGGEVLSGASLILAAGGTLGGVTVSGGGALDLTGLTAGGGQALLARTIAGPSLLSGAKLQSGATIDLGGARVQDGGMVVIDAGAAATATTVLSGGEIVVRSGGEGDGTLISAGGRAVVSAGGAAANLSMHTGARLIDDGVVTLSGGVGVWGGELTGSGQLVETGSGSLALHTTGSDFKGELVIGDGAVELAHLAAIGGAAVVFDPTTGPATLQIDAAYGLAAGGTLTNALSNFSAASDNLDLAGAAFVSGASAAVVGSQLVLTDGGSTYAFDLTGAVAAAYTATSDGHGGTLITASPAQMAVKMTQAMASLRPSHAGLVAAAPHSGGANAILSAIAARSGA